MQRQGRQSIESMQMVSFFFVKNDGVLYGKGRLVYIVH